MIRVIGHCPERERRGELGWEGGRDRDRKRETERQRQTTFDEVSLTKRRALAQKFIHKLVALKGDSTSPYQKEAA